MDSKQSAFQDIEQYSNIILIFDYPQTMDDATVFGSSSNNYCSCCLSRAKLKIYTIKQTSLETVLQTKHLILCYICKQLAKNAEQFIHNVGTSQKMMVGFHNIQDANFKSLKIGPTMHLTVYPTINLGGPDSEQFEVKIECDDNEASSEELTGVADVEMEPPKEEPSDSRIVEVQPNTENLVKFCNNIEEKSVKNEKDLLKHLLKLPPKEGFEMMLKRNTTKVGTKSKVVKNSKKSQDEKKDSLPIDVVLLTKEQCLEERAEKRLSQKYLSAEYKCDYCIKGFVYKPCYDRHMEKHSKDNGKFECDICRLRFESLEKKNVHRRYHLKRHKCMLCNMVRVCRRTLSDHVASKHQASAPAASSFTCAKCSKGFKTSNRLRKHLLYQHKGKVQCAFCSKHFSSRMCYNNHVRRLHASLESATRPAARYSCPACARPCESPSELRAHSAVHSERRDHFCVECNKGFKTYNSLQTHLRTVSVHITPEDLRFPCSVCKKRFVSKGHADRHMNEVHTTNTLVFCDQCGKEYKSKSRLAAHLRAHAGFEKPRNFPCAVCHKAFRSQRELDTHLRVHTGEKPFRCGQCAARFNQNGSLYNHRRLVHKVLGKRRRRGGNNEPQN